MLPTGSGTFTRGQTPGWGAKERIAEHRNHAHGCGTIGHLLGGAKVVGARIYLNDTAVTLR
jgi:hypothetical protein